MPSVKRSFQAIAQKSTLLKPAIKKRRTNVVSIQKHVVIICCKKQKFIAMDIASRKTVPTEILHLITEFIGCDCSITSKNIT